MWRMLFLILVVIGALAVLLAVILGIGVAKVAMVQADDPPADIVPASAPVATAPATVPAAPTGNADPGAPPEHPAAAADRPAAPADAAQAPVLPAVVKPANYVPGTIVLRGSDAKLGGRLLRKSPPTGDLTSWTRPEDYASWVFYPPQGKYRVFVTHANGAESGGQYAVSLGESKKTAAAFLATATPTGGWETFRTDFVGMLDVNEKRTTLAIRVANDSGKPLMRLRQIELIPVEPMPLSDDKDLAMEIMGLTLIEADTGKPLGLVTNMMVIDLATLPPISLRADTSGPVGSVQFTLDKDGTRTESARPFSLLGDEEGRRYTPWKPGPGRFHLTVTPYPEPNAGGRPGKKRTYTLRIASSTPVVLAAKDATLHGGALRLERGEAPAITNWGQMQDWVEWSASVPNAGQYNVELYYAVGKGNGGELVLRAGDARLVDRVASTGGWNAYDRKVVGAVKLSRGKTTIAIKPSDLDDASMLMNLREIRLTPVVDDDQD